MVWAIMNEYKYAETTGSFSDVRRRSFVLLRKHDLCFFFGSLFLLYYSTTRSWAGLDVRETKPMLGESWFWEPVIANDGTLFGGPSTNLDTKYADGALLACWGISNAQILLTNGNRKNRDKDAAKNE